MNETDIANLQSALIAAGHTGDCPVVHAASVDCVPGGECVDWRSRAEKAEAERDTWQAKMGNVLCPEHARPEGMYSGCLHCALQQQSAWWGKLDEAYQILSTEQTIVEQVLRDRAERDELKRELANRAPVSEDTAVMLERVWYRP